MYFKADVDMYNRQNTYELIPDGIYDMVIKTAAFATSKSGRQMINLELEPLKAGAPDWTYNRKVYSNIVLIDMREKGHGLTLQFLKACGLVPDKNGIIGIFPEELVGKFVTAEIYREEYNGTEHNRVRDFKPFAECSDEGHPSIETVPF